MIKEDEYYAERKAEDEEERRKIERDFPEKEDVMGIFPTNEEMKEKAEAQLQSCHCGGRGILRYQDYMLRPGAIGYDVQCLDCRWTTPTCDTPAAAGEKWEAYQDGQKKKTKKISGRKFGEYMEMTIDGAPVSLTFEEDTPLQNHVQAMAYRNGRDIIIEQMIKEELAQANKVWPQFASTHEGWAVLNEEVQEAAEDMTDVFQQTENLFERIREYHAYDGFKENQVGGIKESAIKAIKELIQVAAMCDKFRAMGKEAMQKHIDDLIDKSATVEVRKYGPIPKNDKPIDANDIIGVDEHGHIINKSQPPVPVVERHTFPAGTPISEMCDTLCRKCPPPMGNATMEDIEEAIRDPQNSKIGREIEAGRKARGEK